jgi:hypothetical protein
MSDLKSNIERLLRREWGDTSYSYFAALLAGEDSAKNALEDILSFELEFKMDGNMWCCHAHDFINLQESNAGFGESKREAASDYYSRLD